jgi:polygalacturonase
MNFPPLSRGILALLLLGLPAGCPATQAQATGDAAGIPLPVIPVAVFKVTHYRAVGDGHTPCTAAIRKSIAACWAGGGGTVVVPARKFLTGPI